MNKERKSLGARLRDAREYLELSQDEVARALGISRSAVSLIESGERGVDALELKKLADLYQRPISEFTGAAEYEAPMPEMVAHLARAASKLNEKDRAELLRFAEFLRAKAPPKREG